MNNAMMKDKLNRIKNKQKTRERAGGGEAKTGEEDGRKGKERKHSGEGLMHLKMVSFNMQDATYKFDF